MSDSETALSLTATRRVLIMVAVMLASTLYSTTLLIASTLLPQMQGTMAATSDEIAWAMTFNIPATALMVATIGFLGPLSATAAFFAGNIAYRLAGVGVGA